jgi:hypothetical protein
MINEGADQSPEMNSFSSALTTITGMWADLMTPSATLPMMRRLKPVLPWNPMISEIGMGTLTNNYNIEQRRQGQQLNILLQQNQTIRSGITIPRMIT